MSTPSLPRVTSSQSVFQTPWFDVLEEVVHTDGAPASTYFTVSAGDGCFLLALTEKRTVLMVRQFRPALRCHTVEMPAGGVDPGESPEQAARRELFEETGCCAEALLPIGAGHLMMNRFSGAMHGFVALGCRPKAGHCAEAGSELIELPWSEFLSLVRRGEFIQIGGLGFIFMAWLKGLLPEWATP